MIKKKYLIKDISFNDKKADSCFTDESFVIVDIPSFKDRMNMKDEFSNMSSDDWESNFQMLERFVNKVECTTNDEDATEVKTLDDLTCFADGILFMQWLGETLTHGCVPKKK